MIRRLLTMTSVLGAAMLLLFSGCDIPGMSLRGDYSSGDDWGGGSDEYHSGDDSYEENDTRDGAYLLTESYITAYQYDDDYYEINIPAANVTVEIELYFSHSSGDIDVELLDSSGNRVDASVGVTDSELISTSVSQAGSYYIRVYLDNRGNFYELYWNAIIPDDSYEENDSLSSAYSVSSYTSYYGVQWDDDWYEIWVPSGNSNIQIELYFVDSEGDIDVELVNSSGTFVARSTSTSDNELISTTVSTTGAYYYIRVYYGNVGNAYELYWYSY